MDIIPYLLGFLLSTVFLVSARISCVNEEHHPVDWYVMYKFPTLEKEKPRSVLLEKGESYAYLNEGAHVATWVLSEKRVSSHDSILGNTLREFYHNKKHLTYLLYNDEPAVERGKTPEEYNFTDGHTKGVVVFDEHTGFWLVHSVPKFPPEHAYAYPESGLMFGQSALCITFRTEELNQIGKQLLLNHPNIYSKGYRYATIRSLDADVQSLFSKEPRFVEGYPFKRVTTLRSYLHMKFISFAKNARFNEDLYDGFVAPQLKSSLLVQSWRRGDSPLPPSCHVPLVVKDVTFINMTVFQESRTWHRYIGFSSYDDHSKWAVSGHGGATWVCIGDINRMKSQFERGGGTVCFASPAVSAAYTSIIAATDLC